MNKTYILANHKPNNSNKLANTFKNSILGMDIGIKSEGFASVITLSTIIAIGTILIMYFLFRV